MELQILNILKSFILKGPNMINFCKELKPDVLLFVWRKTQTQILLRNVWAH